MKLSLPIRYRRKAQDFSDLESQLEAALQPVAPSHDYVQALRRKLAVQWDAPRPATSTDTRNILMLIGAGFLSGLLVLLLSIRAVVTIIATIGLLYQFKRQIDEKRPTSLPPAI
jgi:hypothetical protein